MDLPVTSYNCPVTNLFEYSGYYMHHKTVTLNTLLSNAYECVQYDAENKWLLLPQK